MDAVLENAWLIPLLPLMTAGLLALFGKFLKEPLAGWIAFLSVGASFLLSVAAWIGVTDEEHETFTKKVFDWIPAGGFDISLGYRVDPLTVVMLFLITGVGALIHLYAIGYMHGDPNLSRFFFFLNLFVGSMLILVMANNFLVLFIGWELVGACSYLLIGFWYTDMQKSVAAKKAFVTNRVGDFGLLAGMMFLFSYFGTLDFDTIFRTAPSVLSGDNAWVATAVALLLFVGVAGKSAQIPLFVWLPDAMAGPTPVSALIHAATMVTAGVYLIVRSNVLFALSDIASIVVVLVGIGTALFAALIAIGQYNIKKVLAYSTVSQLGYMVAAAGIGARGDASGYVAAQFHVLTHGFFKALLFLCAGAVIHAMHDEEDMRKMGGLAKKLPVTYATYTVGLLAISGIPPFAGFFSKDAILAALFESGEWWGQLAWAIGLVTAFLTAAYMFRQWFMVFHGPPRWDAGVTPHEAPLTMTAPLAILAAFSFTGGFALDVPELNSLLHDWLHPVFGVVGGENLAGAAVEFDGTVMALMLGSVVAAVSGVGVGWFFWHRTSGEDRATLLEKLGPLPRVVREKFYVDQTVEKVVQKPGYALTGALATADQEGIDRVVMGLGGGTKRVGEWLRKGQSGYVRAYASVIAISVGLLAGYAFARGGF